MRSHRTAGKGQRRPLNHRFELLEERRLLAIDPITVSDPSFWSDAAYGHSSNSSISADGQLIVFQSDAENIVPNRHLGSETFNRSNVFLYNRATNLASLVSINLDGNAAGGGAFMPHPVISPDGRYVAFASNAPNVASNLLPGNSTGELYLRDLQSGVTTALGHVNLSSENPVLVFTADSSAAVFVSHSTNLTPETVAPGSANVFRRILATGATQLVSVDLSNVGAGVSVDDDAAPTVSLDGRYVAFASGASTLVDNDDNAAIDVFVRDMLNGATTLVSVDLTGQTSASGNSGRSTPVISRDGRYVAFVSDAENVVPGITLSGVPEWVLYVRDLVDESTVAVSVREDNSVPTFNRVADAAFSADGSTLAFANSTSSTTGLLPNATYTSGGADVYVYDVQDGTLDLASLNAAGTANGDRPSGFASFNHFTFSSFTTAGPGLALSEDGRYLYFVSQATNLASGVTASDDNVYRRDLQLGTTQLVSSTSNDAAAGGNGESYAPAISADGRYVSFTSIAGDLVAKDGNNYDDIFVRDMASAATNLASPRSPLLPARLLAGGSLESISTNGGQVVFTDPVFGQAQYLPGMAHNGEGILVRDTQTGQITPVNVTPDGSLINVSAFPHISGDGNGVVFISGWALDGDHASENGLYQAFLRDLSQSRTTLVSLGADGVAANNHILDTAISADGRYIALVTRATNLVSGLVNNGPRGSQGDDNIYLWDQQTGDITLVSHLPGLPTETGNHVAYGPVFSPDGTKLAFTSRATNLVGGLADTNSADDLFVYSLADGVISAASVDPSGAATGDDVSGFLDFYSQGTFQNRDDFQYRFSADNRYLVFESKANDLVAGMIDEDDTIDIFRRDLQSGSIMLVTTGSDGLTATHANGFRFSVSSDASRVGFLNEQDSIRQAYLRDVIAGTTTLISAIVGSTSVGTEDWVNSIAISPDGTYAAFTATSSDLVPGFPAENPFANSLYYRNLATGVTTLATPDKSGTGYGGIDFSSPLYFASDNTVFFQSEDDNLHAADRNGLMDVFSVAPTGSGAIRGSVFHDDNADGDLDANEPGLQHWLVYIDENLNSQPDAKEPIVAADAAGSFAFNNLRPGLYRLQLAQQSLFQATTPIALDVEITSEGQVVANQNFGQRSLTTSDLIASAVAIEANGQAGQAVQISYTVTNDGQNPVAGSWVDALYLSTTPTLGPDAKRIAFLPASGPLATGENYSVNQSVALPALPPGNYYLIVLADYRSQIADTNRGNNAAASAAPVTIGVPALTIDQPEAGTLLAGEDRYYQVTVGAGQPLLLTLGGAPAGTNNELFVSYGALPTAANYDHGDSAGIGADRRVLIPATQAGIYYVLVHNRAGGSGPLGYSIEASSPSLQIFQIDRAQGGNSGQVTLGIFAAGLSGNIQASLSGSGLPTISAVATTLSQDGTTLYATFDLTGQTLGLYDLTLTKGAAVATLATAFTVVAGTPGNDLEISITGSAFSRDLLPGLAYVTITNKGTTDAIAPLLQVTADKAQLKLVEQDAYGDGVLQFLALGGGNVGVIAPGETVTIPISYFPTTQKAHDHVQFQLTQADLGQTIDWASQKDALRLPSISAEAWDAVYANFVASVGTTVASYQATLARSASYLASVGQPVSDVMELVAFEIQQANAAYTAQSLASVVAAALPAPGFPLIFEQSFQQAISGRYEEGILGVAWTTNWDISATTTPEGDVLIHMSGGYLHFERQSDGSYLDHAGDRNILSQAGGGYLFSQFDGGKMQFNADGELAYVEDANGNRVTLTHTAGRLTALTHSNGQSLTLTYNAQGRLATLSDSHGLTATYGYDATGRFLTSFTDVYGTTNYRYVTGQNAAQNNALAEIAYADNTHIYLGYDNQGRLIDQHRDGGAERYTYAYLAAGGYSVTDSLGNSATYLIDRFGALSRYIDPLGNATAAQYDFMGNLLALDGPLGTRVTYTYDGNGNVTSQTDPLGRKTTFTYDTRDNLTSYTDAKGNTTAYAYDARNNLLSVTYANGASESWQYDPLGQATQLLDARGNLIGITRDTNGNIATTTFDGGSYSYVHDAYGNITSATDEADRVTEFERNDPNNPHLLTAVNYPDGTFLHFTYNIVAQRTQSVDQTGFTINYAYDALGRLSNLSDGGGQLIVSYAYDSAGNLIRKDNGNGTFTTYAYDAAYNVLSITNHAPGGAVNSFNNYTYDALANVVTDVSQDGAWTYTYDAARQLTRAIFVSSNTAILPNQDIAYQYDAVGNRISQTVNGVLTTYVVDQLNQYTTSTTVGLGTTTYDHDADGNLTGVMDPLGSLTTYAYNPLGQLTDVNGAGSIASYAYDPFGNRVSQTLNGLTTNYQFDPVGLGNVVAAFMGSGAYDNSGGLLNHFVHDGGLVSRVDASAAAAYYDFNQLGSTVGLTDAAGQYVNRYGYLPFGETTTIAQTVANPFTFVGQYGVMQDASGAFNMRVRNYDAATGQFFSNDPLGINAGDANLRAYVGNGPTTYIDPSGLQKSGFESRMGHMNSDNYAGQKGPQDPMVKIKADLYNPARNNALPGGQKFLPVPIIKQGKDACGQPISIIVGYKIYLKWKTLKDKQTGRVTGYEPIGKPFATYDAQGNRVGDSPPGDGPAGSGTPPGGNFCGPRLPPPPGDPSFPPGPTSNFDTEILRSGDPNELAGPPGFGPNHFTQGNDVFGYQVFFANDAPEAAVPALDVFVTLQLDADLDWSTFEFTDLGFGKTVVDVPAGRQSFSTTVHTANLDGSPLDVEITADLDLVTGLVTWALISVDPLTGLRPTGVFDGFLPVDDEEGSGQGFVNYLIRPKAALATGTAIDAQASIVFDINAPIVTNVYTNTIDKDRPTSAADPLPAEIRHSSFTVSWSGTDQPQGSGIAFFDVFVSDNGGPFTLWQAQTAATSAVYAGEFGHAYGFYSVATDNVGWVQPTPLAAQATTVLEQAALLVVGADATGGPHVRELQGNDLQLQSNFFAYDDNFLGGVRVAVGDINGDGTPDIIAGAGPGPGGSQVRVYNGVTETLLTGPLGSFVPYPGFTGGLFVAAGDVNGDGRDDLITGAGAGGGPHVRVFSGMDGSQLYSFFAYDPRFTGGVTVAAGDINGDSHAEIVTGAGAGGGPHVRTFDGLTGQQLPERLGSFYAYEANFGGGVFVAVGDIDGDGLGDLITGAGAGGGPHVRVLAGSDGAELHSFFAFDAAFGGGVRVAAAVWDADGKDDLITGAGSGGGPHVRVRSGEDLTELASFYAYATPFTGGVFVASLPFHATPLRLAPTAAALPAAERITQAQLDLIREAALARWQSAGLSSDAMNRLNDIRFAVANLPGDLLGLARSGEIFIDEDAASQGWFVDPAPLDDEEFLAALPVAAARQHVDLLSVVLHELGHVAGLEHDDSSPAGTSLMNSSLVPGVRHLPSSDLIDSLLAAW